MLKRYKVFYGTITLGWLRAENIEQARAMALEGYGPVADVKLSRW